MKTLTKNEDNVKKNRRAFLKKAGKFAVYTPPAMMLLMHPSANAVMKSAIGGCDDKYGCDQDDKKYGNRDYK